MAQKTLISMDRDRLRKSIRTEDGSPLPDTPHSLSSVCPTPPVSPSFEWPVYKEPSLRPSFSFIPEIASIQSMKISPSPISAISSFAFKGTTVDACGADDGTIRYLKFDESPRIVQPMTHPSFISALSFDSSSDRIFWATGSGEVGHAPFLTSQTSRSFLHPHSATIWSIQVLDNTLLTGSMDQTSRVIDLGKEKVRQTFKGFHSDSVNVARFWSSYTVLTGSADKTVCLWDLRTGAKVSSWYNLPSESPIIDISDLGGGLFACATIQGHISVCDKDRVRKNFSLQKTCVSKILRLSSNILAIACDDGTVKFLDIESDHIASLPLESDASILNLCRRSDRSLSATTSSGTIHVLNFS